MVGQGVLRECLLDDEISSLVTVGRTTTGIASARLLEIQHADLLDYGAIESRLTGFDACFFCLGISSAGMKEADYERLTYGISLAAAQTLSRLNPEMVFTYVSGAGTDRSEQGQVMWARVKGRTENTLLKLPFKAAYMIRPGVIRPMHGAVSKTRSHRLLYAVMAPVLPLLQWAFPKSILTTEIIASHGAMAANALGLTTQVPVRAVYLTSGPSWHLKLGEQSVELRHAPRWQLVMADRPAGEAIRALAWLGEAHTSEALAKLQRRLPETVLVEIASARPRLPTWLAQQVSRLAPNG